MDASAGDPPRLEDLLGGGREALDTSQLLGDLGVAVFSLISQWRAWVDRRVETVRFHEVDTVRRSVSVDFTWPALPARARLPGDQPRYLVPIAVLRKRRLTSFDLRDESGRPLPLVARWINEAVSASVMMAAAQAFPVDARRLGPTPASLLDDFWSMSNDRGKVALDTWRNLGRPRPDEDDDEAMEEDWRRALVASNRFRSLTHDLVRNFVIATVLPLRAGERRIIKMAYDEPTIVPRVSGLRPRRRRWHLPGADLPDAPGRRCTLTVRATLEEDQGPLAGVVVRLDGHPHDFRTDETGLAADQVAADEYVVTDTPPEGVVATTPPLPGKLIVSEDRVIEFTYRRDVTFVPDPEEPRLSAWGKFTRLAALDAKVIVIDAPAIGHARSYHFELEIPDGIQATKAQLIALPNYRLPGAAEIVTDPSDVHRSTGHRVHLYRSGIGQDNVGRALFWFRPRPSTVLRGATIVAFLSLVLLTAITLRWEKLGVQAVAPAVTLMLAVPGGLAAYVARSQRSRFTSQLLSGLRVIAFSGALWGLLAGLAILLSRTMSLDADGDLIVGDPARWTHPMLVLLLIGNVTTLAILDTGYRRSRHPPERADESAEW